MKRPIIVLCALALGGVGNAFASGPQPLTKNAINTPSPASATIDAEARKEAAALSRAQVRAVASYKRHEAQVAVAVKKRQAKADAAERNAAHVAKQEAHALARAYDRAAANHKQHVSRRVAAERIAQEKASAVAARAARDARKRAEALVQAYDRSVVSYKRYASRRLAAEKNARDEASVVGARTARDARKQSEALALAYDRAVVSHKRYVSRRVAAEKLAQETAAAAASQVAKLARQEAVAAGAAQDRVVAYYRRSIGKGDSGHALSVKRIEKLACFTGIQDRHARIGVQLIDGKIDYFAYYSKWKPRTCSIAAERNGPYSRWEDHGATSKVTLVDDKGVFTIDRKGGAFRFVFHDIDRMRYCGMSGKINGSLTVVRGKSTCIVEGVMDGHEG